MRKIFIDTEFTGLKKEATLISLGCVGENGEAFYAEFTDYNKADINEWLKKEVVDRLLLEKCGMMEESAKITEEEDRQITYARGNKRYIKNELIYWLTMHYGKEKVEVWSDTLAYDWVLLCDLFGGAMGLTEQIYYIPFDIATAMKIRGIDPDISRESFSGFKGEGMKHNALHDAEIIKACYDKIFGGN